MLFREGFQCHRTAVESPVKEDSFFISSYVPGVSSAGLSSGRIPNKVRNEEASRM